MRLEENVGVHTKMTITNRMDLFGDAGQWYYSIRGKNYPIDPGQIQYGDRDRAIQGPPCIWRSESHELDYPGYMDHHRGNLSRRCRSREPTAQEQVVGIRDQYMEYK